MKQKQSRADTMNSLKLGHSHQIHCIVGPSRSEGKAHGLSQNRAKAAASLYCDGFLLRPHGVGERLSSCEPEAQPSARSTERGGRVLERIGAGLSSRAGSSRPRR